MQNFQGHSWLMCWGVLLAQIWQSLVARHVSGPQFFSRLSPLAPRPHFPPGPWQRLGEKMGQEVSTQYNSFFYVSIFFIVFCALPFTPLYPLPPHTV